MRSFLALTPPGVFSTSPISTNLLVSRVVARPAS